MPLNQTCGQGVHCFGTEYPLSNFSSELDDTLEYVALRFPGQGWVETDPTVINGPGGVTPPPLGPPITSPGGCLGIGESTSQTAANSTALAAGLNCGLPPVPGGAYSIPATPAGVTENTSKPDGGVPNGPSQIPQTAARPGSGTGNNRFYNNDTTGGCATCPDGTVPGTFTIKAGTYAGRTQQQADAQAALAASQQATTNCVCAPDLSADYCQNDVIGFEERSIYGANAPFQISLVGTAPTGFSVFMTGDSTFAAAGTMSVPGTFTFKVRVTDANGNYAEADSTIDILGVSNINDLPSGFCKNPYSAQLLGAGGVGPYTFVCLNLAEIPAGLTVHESGLIDGTPTECGTSVPIDIGITDANGRYCEVSGVIDINGPCVRQLSAQSVGYFTYHDANPPYYDINQGPMGEDFDTVVLCPGSSPPINIRVTLEWKATDLTCRRNIIGGQNCPSATLNFTGGSIGLNPAEQMLTANGTLIKTGTWTTGDAFDVKIWGRGTTWQVTAKMEQI
jgi:hypothetical protein